MECDICQRGHDAKRLPFVCAVDARNQIYEGRIKNLQLLMENADLQKQVSDLLEGKEAIEKLQAQQRMAEDRTTQILAAADQLRNEIKAAKDEIQARKAALTHRRSDLSSSSEGVAERRVKQQAEVEKSIDMVKYRWAQSAEDMARTRCFLCKEAARLYGLKRTKKASSGRYEYYLGRVPVVDLTAMNTLTPEAISTSLSHVSHILMLCSHYLSIRLPAAITLPHRDYPRPTISSIVGSYSNKDTAFPYPSGVATPSSEGRGLGSEHVPRPRPLFIDKPLALLAKEDPAAYSYFLEGVTLLAYDIAWACTTQGISVGDKSSFEDICNIGRNMYSLLISQQTDSGVLYPGDTMNKNSTTNIEDVKLQRNWMGRFSDATLFYYLRGTDGSEFTRHFKLPSPMKLADRLKKKLVSETPAPDWEVLDDDAWKVEEEPEDGLAENQKPSNKETLGEDKSSPRRGSSGWMKVKNR
ncbi:Fc.00g021100.m01.CDS01 [Cosmosporella sp. VM-42]